MHQTLFKAVRVRSPGEMRPFFSRMFGGMGKTQDIITLFHSPSSSASARAHTILKQASAQADSPATEDQASDHSAQSKAHRDSSFELEVTEEVPTEDQLKSIVEYLGKGDVSSIVKGATSVSDAARKLKNNQGAFQHPVIVDWNAGKAVIGDNESEILKLVNQQ